MKPEDSDKADELARQVEHEKAAASSHHDKHPGNEAKKEQPSKTESNAFKGDNRQDSLRNTCDKVSICLDLSLSPQK